MHENLPAPTAAHCPVCATPVERAPRACPRCATPHHGDCWDYAGGCAIFGCETRPGAAPMDPARWSAARPLLRLWRALFGLEWAACVGFGLSLAAMPLVMVAQAILDRFIGPTHGLGMLLFVVITLVPSLTGLAILGYALVFLPQRLVRLLVESRLGADLGMAKGEPRKLADRLEPDPWTQRFEAVARVLLWANLLVFAVGSAVLVGAAPRDAFTGILTLALWFGLPGVVAWAVTDDASQRRRRLAVIQNRLIASDKSLPP